MKILNLESLIQVRKITKDLFSLEKLLINYKTIMNKIFAMIPARIGSVRLKKKSCLDK